VATKKVSDDMNENDKQSGGDGGNNWMKNLVIWVGILVALALVVSLIG
jgi:cell division protease FtsH